MSKKLILCVVLALSLILVGTGYAYWTDTLNVTTKATTGDLDVTFVDLGAYAQYANETETNGWSIIDGIVKGDYQGFIPSNFWGLDAKDYNEVFNGNKDAYYDHADGYNRVEMDAELLDPGEELENDIYPGFPYGKGDVHGDTISIELYNMYPGYAQAFRSDIINTGSIAARLSAVNFKLSRLIVNEEEIDVNAKTKAMIGVALLVQDEDYPTTNPTYGEIVKLASHFSGDDEVFELGGVKFVRLSALENLDEEILENFILIPEDNSQHRADLFIGIAVDPDADGVYTTGSVADMKKNDDSKTQNKGIKLDITFGWDQFNAGSDPDTDNILKKQN